MRWLYLLLGDEGEFRLVRILGGVLCVLLVAGVSVHYSRLQAASERLRVAADRQLEAERQASGRAEGRKASQGHPYRLPAELIDEDAGDRWEVELPPFGWCEFAVTFGESPSLIVHQVPRAPVPGSTTSETMDVVIHQALREPRTLEDGRLEVIFAYQSRRHGDRSNCWRITMVLDRDTGRGLATIAVDDPADW